MPRRCLPQLRGATETERVLTLLDVLYGSGAELPPHTTNISVVDAEGNACVLTSSLGLCSGDWVPGFDLHLNSILGEKYLHRGDLGPGDRMGSMMAPSIALDGDGFVLGIGSAGAARLRTAIVGVTAGILDEGLEPQAAVDLFRAFTGRTGSSTSNQVWTRGRSPSSSRAASKCAAGPS